MRFSKITDSGGGGATTLEPPEAPQQRWPWYLAGLAVLGGAVVVIVLGARAGRREVPLPDDPVIDDEVVEPQVGSAEDEPPASPPSRPDPAPAADRLARLMANVRLYATVAAIGDAIEIRSTSCADPGLARPLLEVAPELREAGIVTVRCRALHGAEQWTRPLP